MAVPRATIGIISLGDMGSGLARLLVAHGYAVATNVEGRSPDTIARAKAVSAILVPTDAALVSTCDVILSVVPPRDALATAQRIATALSSSSSSSSPRRAAPLYFADMNAVSPGSVKSIAALFAAIPPSTARFIDGSILGGPPSPPKTNNQSATTTTTTTTTSSKEGEGEEEEESPGSTWTRPLLPTSGPYPLTDLSPFGPHLAAVLRTNHISDAVGAASGLKMCFASLSKGYAAIAVQTVTTARRLGVLGELRASLTQLAPGNLERMDRAVVGMGPKAYRWVREMEEISATHAGEGEGEGGEDEDALAPEFRYLFRGAAEVFRTVADDTVLGAEKVGKRVRGTTAEDVADAVLEGLRERKGKRAKKGIQTDEEAS